MAGRNKKNPVANEKLGRGYPNHAAKLLHEAGALEFCETADELSKQVMQLCEDEETNKKMGHAAAHVIENNRGAVTKLMGMVENSLSI